MSEITDWASGARCERHDLAYCTDCRDLAKIVRHRDGSLGMKSDCAVQTFAEITGCDYDEALDLVKAGGYVPGRGTPKSAVRSIMDAAGYKASACYLTIDQAVAASKSGRAFWVSGTKGSKGHAWSITEGRQNRPFHPPFRYVMFEITA